MGESKEKDPRVLQEGLQLLMGSDRKLERQERQEKSPCECIRLEV